MASLDSSLAVNAELERLGALPEPVVLRLARRPGQKEERWVQLLTTDAPGRAVADSGGVGVAEADRLPAFEAGPGACGDDVGAGGLNGEQEPSDSTDGGFRSLLDEVSALRAEVGALRAVVEQLQTEETKQIAAIEQLQARLNP
jgi:uncharacterized protein YceH (UPF0502 family)